MASARASAPLAPAVDRVGWGLETPLGLAYIAFFAAPLLLLWGIRDPWINAPGRRASFQRHAPENTHEVVLEAGHCPHDEVPDQVNAALLDWIAGLSSGAAPLQAGDRAIVAASGQTAA